MGSKRALITGITGQDGSYLAEHLLSQGYQVHGMIRRCSVENTWRIDHLKGRLYLHYGDMTDSGAITDILKIVKPDEIYNLAAQSHVGLSFQIPRYTVHSIVDGVVNLANAMRMVLEPTTRLYQATTSELYGKITAGTIDEQTVRCPVSPYGIAKHFAFEYVRMLRETYGMFACNGILFNHESPRRGHQFVTKKIIRWAVGYVTEKLREPLLLGNVDARRDWGYAMDYVKAMHLMMQHDTPDDYVVSTGVTYSVRDFCTLVMKHLNHPIAWDKENGADVAYTSSGRVVIRSDKSLLRPADVGYLCGDASKAKRQLGWRPETHIRELIEIMVNHEIKYL
jgi:GDPmannose 4,6-dehydratase